MRLRSRLALWLLMALVAVAASLATVNEMRRRARREASDFFDRGRAEDAAIGAAREAPERARAERRRRAAATAEPAPPPVVPASPEEDKTLTETDRRVLDALLKDLLEDPEFDPAFSGGRRLFLLSQAPEGGMRLDRQPEEVRSSFARRNEPESGSHALRDYRPANPLVTTRDPETLPSDEFGLLEYKRLFPDTKGYVRPYLPAYSGDGRTALVVLEFGPTAHGAWGAYTLRYENGRWVVLWDELGYLG